MAVGRESVRQAVAWHPAGVEFPRAAGTRLCSPHAAISPHGQCSQRFLGCRFGCLWGPWAEVAFGPLPDAAQRLAWWQTASDYHLFHALALGLLALSCGRLPGVWARLSGGSTLVGIALFSGSLYAMALSGRTGLGAITPIGGLGLLLGWLALAVGAWRGS